MKVMKFVIQRNELTPREMSLLKMLEKSYTDDVAREVLVPLVTQTSSVSLRVLDWTVTNWAKQHNVVCTSSIPGDLTNIHNSYRCMLGFWKRRFFDPFRRRKRVKVLVDGVEYDTTLGQANFALWAHTSGTLAYVMSHMDEIEKDQNLVAHEQKTKRREALKTGRSRRREELTSAPRSLCVAYLTPCSVTFDE